MQHVTALKDQPYKGRPEPPTAETPVNERVDRIAADLPHVDVAGAHRESLTGPSRCFPRQTARFRKRHRSARTAPRFLMYFGMVPASFRPAKASVRDGVG